MSNPLHPGLFPIGSPQSRAIARALIESRWSTLDLVELYSSREGHGSPEFGEWESFRPGSMTRRCRIPAGMTFDEALQVAGLPVTRTNGKHIRMRIDV